MKKHFISLIPRELRRRARAEFKNNPPKVEAEDKVKAFLLQKELDYWWKNGGWKKVLKRYGK